MPSVGRSESVIECATTAYMASNKKRLKQLRRGISCDGLQFWGDQMLIACARCRVTVTYRARRELQISQKQYEVHSLRVKSFCLPSSGSW